MLCSVPPLLLKSLYMDAQELPASVGSEMAPHPPAEPATQATMDIAWRYQNLPVVKV